MKRFVMFLVVICMLFSAYADAQWANGNITIENDSDLIGSNARLPINFDNTGSSVTIGFSTTAVGENNYSEITPITSATLVKDTGAYTASYGLTSPLYIYWQIISGTKIDLRISALTGEKNTNGEMSSGDKLMDWYVYTSEGAGLLNTENSATGNNITTGHDPFVAIGKTGSQKIYIITPNLTTVPAGNYSGTLVVTIKAGQ